MAAAKPLPPRRRRWVLRTLLLLAFLLGAGLVYVTRPSTLASIIIPAASRAVGGQVTASRVSLTGFDGLLIEDARIRVDGWEGESGELAYADSIRIQFSPLAFLLGGDPITSVAVQRLDLRLIERADLPGTFSLLDLKPEVSAERSTTPTAPPAVSIEELVVENGVATRTGYNKLGELRFRGSLHPVADAVTVYEFALDGRPDADGHLAIGAILGRFSPERRTISLSVDDLVVDGTQLAIAPIAVREWMRKLALEGRLRHAQFEYEPGSDPIAELDVEGVAMDLPAEVLGSDALSDAWSGFANGRSVDVRATPRMTLREGVLRLSGDRIELRGLRGELGTRDASARVIPLPFECEFSLDIPRADLPAFEWDARETWFTKAAALAPFSMRISIERFSSPAIAPGAPDTLQLPRAAAKILSDFNITKWTIDVDTRFERGSPTAQGEPAAMKSSGTLRLTQCAGAFEEFPYPLDDVNGVISFEDDNLVVERITGRGGENAFVRMDGRLDGIATGAEIDLRIECPDAPIDEKLFASFDEGTRTALELLFDARAADMLGKSGLLPDATLLTAQRRELTRLGDGDAAKSARDRLSRSVAAGPFALGGRCGFRLRVYSPAGFGKPIMVTGDVDVRDAGILFGRFPYPLRLKQGSVTVLDEAIVIGGGGLRAITPAGGTFVVSGSLRVPRDGKGGRDLRPLIEISDSDDALNPAVLAAIPHDGNEIPAGWPGESLAPGGELLRALGLTGAMQMTGLVTSKSDGREDFRVRIAFAEGTAAPSEAGRAWLAEEGLPWPPDFTLEDCAARLDIVPERVSFEQCTGRHGSGSIVASGYADLEGPESLVDLELHALPIDRAFEGYLAPEENDAAERFRKFGPTGAIDGVVRRRVTAAGVETRGSFVPQFLEVTLDGSRIRADRVAGRVAIDERGLRAESLELRLTDGNQEDGILRLSGPLALAASSSLLPLDVTLAGGRFQSPLVREMLGPRSKSVVDWLRSTNAAGLFDAHYTRGAAERLELTPRTLALGETNARVALDFAPDARIVAAQDTVEWTLDARLVEGNSVMTPPANADASLGTLLSKGTTSFGTRGELTASLMLDAAMLTPALRTQLPPPLDTSAAAIDLTSTGRFKLELPTITARWNPQSTTGDVESYTLSGTATFDRASFTSGVKVDGLVGVLPLALRYEPAAAKPIEFRATLDCSRATVFDRATTGVEATINATDTGDALAIAVAGDVARGRFDVTADVDFTAKRYAARARVADADYGLIVDPKRFPAGTPSATPFEGRFEALVAVEGPMGGTPSDVAARTGRGNVAVREARLADAPVAMRALQLTQLMLPLNASLSASDARFTISGDTVRIDPCELTSGTLRLVGTGTMDIPTFALAIRMYPKGTVPIFSDVVSGIMNQLFAIDIRGTLGDPKTSIAPIPGANAQPTMEFPAVQPTVPDTTKSPSRDLESASPPTTVTPTPSR